MSTYRWQQLRFTKPTHLQDQSAVVLVDNPQDPSYNITIIEDRCENKSKYMDMVNNLIQQTAQALPFYKKVLQKNIKMGEKAQIDAVWHEHSAVNNGRAVVQVQVYFLQGTSLWTITMTADGAQEESGKKSLEAMINTMSLIETGK